MISNSDCEKTCFLYKTEYEPNNVSIRSAEYDPSDGKKVKKVSDAYFYENWR